MNRQVKDAIMNVKAWSKKMEDIASTYYATTNDENEIRKQTISYLYKTGDKYYDDETIVKNENIIRQAYQNHAVEQLSEAHERLNVHIATINEAVNRAELQAVTGARLVGQYAEANGIDTERAKAELDDYAKIKTRGFSDTVADRYACLRNRDSLHPSETSKAYQYHEEERKALEIPEMQKAIEYRQSYARQDPKRFLSDYNSSGAVVVRMLQQESEA
jgi:hypothetical protein